MNDLEVQHKKVNHLEYIPAPFDIANMFYRKWRLFEKATKLNWIMLYKRSQGNIKYWLFCNKLSSSHVYVIQTHKRHIIMNFYKEKQDDMMLL